MKERGILFSAPMIPPILDGRKTQTRRIPNLRELQRSTTRGYDWTFRDRRARWQDVTNAQLMALCPYGGPGDRLWVRETWMPDPPIDGWPGDISWQDDRRIDGVPEHYRKAKHCIFAASWDGPRLRWRPGIHMPRWACRIVLDVVTVRIERLHDITEDDAKAEGVKPFPRRDDGDCWDDGTHRSAFEYLWGEINGWDSWKSNPWVWRVEFRKAAA
jgi:hypothetical protein